MQNCIRRLTKVYSCYWRQNLSPKARPTRNQRILSPNPHRFETALQSGLIMPRVHGNKICAFKNVWIRVDGKILK